MSALGIKVLDETVARIRRQILQSQVQLAAGLGITDYSDYRYYVGGIKAFNDSITIIEEVLDDLKKGE